MDYKQIIESAYNRKNWQVLLRDIFGSRATFFATPTRIEVNSDTAKTALYLGKIDLADGKSIAVYEVPLAESVVIERNKVSIRNLLVTHWRNSGFAGAFMFCFKENESVLRFSYVSEVLAFNEEGKLATEATDTKRFTYYLGEGHRSRTAIDQFTKLKGSGQTLDDITKAFSIEAVSDAFFAGYKNIYEDIVEYMTGKRMTKVGNKWEEVTVSSGNPAIVREFSVFENPLKSMRDYAKKLMGRLVFLQFIQKKGWLGVKKNAKWGTGDKEFMFNLFTNSKQKEDFIEKVLEPLFNDINTQREGDLVSDKNVGLDIKVPFLNGGLFERDKEDETAIKLPAKFFEKLFEFFSQYNFTIDENDPNDTEVGVDPEMLGRIFENLLEDNKDKGAFYTPKEIVRYMCAESLIAYLQTDITSESDKENIRHFVSTHEVSFLNETLKPMVKQKLRDVKICDPAIGSGAFPIGLLNELFACFEALEGEQANRAEIKKHIIQNSIYGVDIEKGAVDIARLRFWLSLVVDEDKPDALPNLDFKIMQGNSLLEQYKSADLSQLVADKKAGMQRDIFDDELTDYRSNLNNLINNYFNTREHSAKMELKRQIQRNVNEQMKAADINVDFNALGIDVAGNDQFFLWHTWFADVFNRPNNCNGFDIVIGNPPYGANIDDLVKTYGKLYPNTSHGFKDIYKYFFEQGFRIMKQRGTLCYITPSTFLRQPRYGDVRRVIMKNRILQLIDLGENIFDAVVPVAISLIQNSKKDDLLYCDLTNSVNILKVLGNIRFKKIPQSLYENTPNNIFIEEVRCKKDNEVTLNDILEFKDAGINYQRVNVGLKEKGKSDLSSRLLYEGERESVVDVEYWKGVDINSYYIKPHTKRFCRPSIQLKNNEHVILNKDYFSIHSKLLWRQTAPYPIVCIDYCGIWFGRSIQAGIIKKEFRTILTYEYLCALLNSKYLRSVYEKNVRESGRVFPQVKLEKLKPLPIIIPTHEQQQSIVFLVNQILTAKKSNPQADTSDIEANLDNLVYELYELTDEEISIVENGN